MIYLNDYFNKISLPGKLGLPVAQSTIVSVTPWRFVFWCIGVSAPHNILKRILFLIVHRNYIFCQEYIDVT